MISLIPLPYKLIIAAAISAILFALGFAGGESHVQGKWNAQRAATQAAEASAIQARIAANKIEAQQHADINAAIKKAKNEDLAPVVAAIAADRLRIGPALCPRFAATPEAASASRGDGPDHDASGVRPDVERDLIALKIKVAESLATGRAAQKFINDNGLAP